jgi:hypothetical protein
LAVVVELPLPLPLPLLFFRFKVRRGMSGEFAPSMLLPPPAAVTSLPLPPSVVVPL